MPIPAQPRLVSVIIGTFNRPHTLRVALASIRALEGPDLKFEILVGDNGVNPETRSVVEEFGGIYDQTSVVGCPAARNLAMKRATGEFIAFLDDDDVWLPGHVRPHIALMDSNPEYQAVFGQIVSTDEHLTPTGEPWPSELPADGDFFADMMSGYFPQVGGTVVRRAMLEKYGLMDETLIGDSDWDWQLRIAADHKIGFVKVPCVLFRQRARSTFDTLQLRRTQFTRKIFKRHARGANRKRLGSTLQVARAYYGTVNGYFQYFMDAAEYRIDQRQRLGAAKALLSAASINPTRTVRNLIRQKRHRRTLAGVIGLPVAKAKGETAGRIDIAFGFDGRYVPHAANVMASIVRHAPGANLRFIVLQADVTPEQKKRMERIAPGVDFVWVDVGDDDLPAYATRGHLNRTVLFRLGVETLAPADCKRLLYIDADVIVVGDVRELWKTDLGPHAVGAVTDCYQDADTFAELWGLPSGGRYFNAGVQVIDLEKVRAGKLFSKALDFVVAHDKKLLFGDQDALNYVLWNNTAVVEPTWNVQRYLKPGEISRETAPDRRWGHAKPRLIHYIGTEKPWMRNVWHPWAWLYWENLKRTEFAKDVKAAFRMDFLQMMRLRLRWLLKQPGGVL